MSLTADQITFISIGAGVIGILIYLAYTARDLFWFVKSRKTIKNAEQALDRVFDRLSTTPDYMESPSPADLASSRAFQSPVGSGIGGFDPAAMAPSLYSPDPSMAAGVRPEQFLGGGALAQQASPSNPLVEQQMDRGRYTDYLQSQARMLQEREDRRRAQDAAIHPRAISEPPATMSPEEWRDRMMSAHGVGEPASGMAVVRNSGRPQPEPWPQWASSNSFNPGQLDGLSADMIIMDDVEVPRNIHYAQDTQRLIQEMMRYGSSVWHTTGLTSAEPPAKEPNPEPEAPIVDMSGKRRIDL